jgi:heme a synthase
LTTNSFISTQYRQGHKLALFTFLLAFIVILLGGYTRLTDAGLSCPDWPHSYGYLTAPHTTSQLQDAVKQFPATPLNVKKAWTEMTHRYFAGIEGLLILILSATFLFAKKRRNTKSMIISTLLIGLLVVQVVLGMLTVTEKLKPVIVLSHLLTGLSLLSLLWWAYLALYLHKDFTFKERIPPRLLPWIGLGLLLVIGQITLGGWVSTHLAGLACVDFPYCNGNLLPAIQWQQLHTDLISIHMLHRLGALVTAAYLALLALRLSRFALFRSAALLIILLITFQLALGVLNIIWLRPVLIASLHQGVAILLLLSLITILVKASLARDKKNLC